jgi:hypothetical protein
MIEKRRPKLRRTGERFWHVAGVWLLLAALIGSAAWGGYEYGRWSMGPVIASLQSDVIVAKAISRAGHVKGIGK